MPRKKSQTAAHAPKKATTKTMSPQASPDGVQGARVAAARVARGWTQFELARRSNIHVSAISLVESGRKGLNASSVVALCRALEVSADYLLGLSEDSLRK